MENLSISDGPPPSTRQGLPSIPQLPPQLFTTAASLLDLTDKKLLVTLRDGRKLMGILRSWDQYGNLVLQDSIERRFLTLPPQSKNTEIEGEPRHLYSDEERGIYIVRGENIVLMGEIDLDKDELPPPASTLVFASEFHSINQRHKRGDHSASPSSTTPSDGQNAKDVRRLKKLRALGFEGEHAGDVIF